MEKGEDGAVANKAARKRRSRNRHSVDDSSRNPDEDLEVSESKRKKKNVEPVMSLGHSSKLSDRHKRQLACLAALVTSNKTELTHTDKREDILHDGTSSTGLYMEWCKEKETYFLYAASQTRAVILKFELLAVTGLEAVPEVIEIRNPLLVFSEGFGNDENWEGTKMLLFEIFSKPGAESNSAQDYVYSFTRSSGRIYFRVYKINSLPATDEEGSMDQVFATFLLRPIETRSLDNVDYFLDLDRFLISQGGNSLNAPSSSGSIRHLQHLGLHRLLLPAPPDLSEWEGFNTNISEHFDRFHAFKQSKIPGIGPERVRQFDINIPVAYYWHLCLPFKVFARSLIVCAGNTIQGKACYVDIKEENIFFRGKTAKILGSSLTNYTLQRAISNLNNVGYLLETLLMKMGLKKENFPADLQQVLRLLKRNNLNDENPVHDYDIIKNFICWMDGEERNHVIDDLLQDFLYRMSYSDQLHVGVEFPPFTQWVNIFDTKNFLLKMIKDFGLPKKKLKNKKTKGQEARELAEWLEMRRRELLGYVKDKNEARALHNAREYFKTINNSLKHLVQTLFEKDGVKLSPDEVDLIVSSQFAATYAQVQVEVPKALVPVDPNGKGSYKRFARYFPSDDSIQFKLQDEK